MEQLLSGAALVGQAAEAPVGHVEVGDRAGDGVEAAARPPKERLAGLVVAGAAQGQAAVAV